MRAYWSERDAAGRAESASGLILVSARPASHRETAVYWIVLAVTIDTNLALKKLFRQWTIALDRWPLTIGAQS
jgi:hypothetical protein